jgi:hypothetical protein
VVPAGTQSAGLAAVAFSETRVPTASVEAGTTTAGGGVLVAAAATVVVMGAGTGTVTAVVAGTVDCALTGYEGIIAAGMTVIPMCMRYTAIRTRITRNPSETLATVESGIAVIIQVSKYRRPKFPAT